MLLEDLLRAFEFAGGSPPNMGVFSLRRVSVRRRASSSSSETAAELLVIATAGAWLALTGWFCEASRPCGGRASA